MTRAEIIKTTTGPELLKNPVVQTLCDLVITLERENQKLRKDMK